MAQALKAMMTTGGRKSVAARQWHERGISHVQGGRFEEALECIEKSIALEPRNAEFHRNHGLVFVSFLQPEKALDCFDKAIKYAPDFAMAFFSRANAQFQLQALDLALKDYFRCVHLLPDFDEAHANIGNIFFVQKQWELALSSYENALKINPELVFLPGNILLLKMKLCRWKNFERQFQALRSGLESGVLCVSPLPLLTMTDAPALLKTASCLFVEKTVSPVALPLEAFTGAVRNKIRIGYFSSDFRDHALTYLISDLFFMHDRDNFEIVGVSLCHNQHHEIQKKIKNGFDEFHEAGGLNDTQLIKFARSLHLTIAVDLNGHTQGARPAVFISRVAPLQVSYLGFLGTSGMPSMDYLIADDFLIPEESRSHYTEKIVYMPEIFQVNCMNLNVTESNLNRSHYGLPDSVFVFCCFNNSHKITPTLFDSWMRILSAVPESVLFLFADTEAMKDNLRAEAKNRGVHAQRLIFGERLAHADYLARYRVADLFLDTYPYNAGATGSDALRMGLPLVTCAGAAYASRIAGSLLHSLGLGDLVAHSIAQYERLAIALATDSTRLKKIRQTLRANLASSPLFDTPRFARHLEAAYLQMYERLCAGKPVADIRVAKTLESRLEPSPWLRALRRLGALFQSRSTTA